MSTASNSIGTLWDKAERERVQAADMDALSRLEPPAIRQKLFPQPVTRRLQQPHASIGFSDLESPEYVATLLLFYDKLVVEGCRNCIKPDILPFASDLIDRGLIVPLPQTRYESYAPETLKFFEKYQDDHVSPQAQTGIPFCRPKPCVRVPCPRRENVLPKLRLY